MNLILPIPLLLMLVASARLEANTLLLDKMIYGEDDRKIMSELSAEADSKTLIRAKSILAQIPNWRISSSDEGTILVSTKSLQSGLNFCEEEKFLELPLVSSCTAFLVGPELIVTAGHCIKDKYDCKKQTWVLDYDTASEFIHPNGVARFQKTKTYQCAELISWSENQKLDYALVRLDRKIEDRSPLPLRRNGKIDSREPLMVIGHPLGMPKMVTDNIFIRDNSLEYIFKTNADTFSGNSGSPVIGLDSGLVEGILVRGDEDFKMDVLEGCQRASICADKECRGESVMRSPYLPLKYIPKL